MSGQYVIPKKKFMDTVNCGKDRDYSESSSSSSNKRKSTSPEEPLSTNKKYDTEFKIPKKSPDTSDGSVMDSICDSDGSASSSCSYSGSSVCSHVSLNETVSRSEIGENPLLVYAPGRSEYIFSPFIVVDHPLLGGISGHYQSSDFEEFYTNDMHQKVVDFLCDSDCSYDRGNSRIDRCFMDKYDVRDVKHSTLTDFFWSNKIGSRETLKGDVYRGTIIFESLS